MFDAEDGIQEETPTRERATGGQEEASSVVHRLMTGMVRRLRLLRLRRLKWPRGTTRRLWMVTSRMGRMGQKGRVGQMGQMLGVSPRTAAPMICISEW